VSAFIAATFGELAPFLADYGYAPVPIRPGAKAPMIDDWQAGHPPDHYLPHRDPDSGKVTDCSKWGTGILTRTCPAVDLDIRDKEVVRVLVELATEMLGPSPFRIGQPPKVLLPFSTSQPFDKATGRWWALPGDDWNAPDYSPHRIEILGRRQQFCAYSRHPRGSFYRWCRGEPMATHQIDLPEIDAAAAVEFVAAAELVLVNYRAFPLRKENGLWCPDVAPRHRAPAGPIESAWQAIEPEVLALVIDAKHARRLKAGAWITSCPAHRSEGHRSLSIHPRAGGGSIVHCFGGCAFVDIARAIADIVGRRAA
jgi:hypothetical protein